MGSGQRRRHPGPIKPPRSSLPPTIAISHPLQDPNPKGPERSISSSLPLQNSSRITMPLSFTSSTKTNPFAANDVRWRRIADKPISMS